jgi:hypothetical protein
VFPGLRPQPRARRALRRRCPSRLLCVSLLVCRAPLRSASALRAARLVLILVALFVSRPVFLFRFAPPACCARRLVVLSVSRPGFLYGSLAAARPGRVLCPAARASWPVPASPVLLHASLRVSRGLRPGRCCSSVWSLFHLGVRLRRAVWCPAWCSSWFTDRCSCQGLRPFRLLLRSSCLRRPFLRLRCLDVSRGAAPLCFSIRCPAWSSMCFPRGFAPGPWFLRRVLFHRCLRLRRAVPGPASVMLHAVIPVGLRPRHEDTSSACCSTQWTPCAARWWRTQ